MLVFLFCSTYFSRALSHSLCRSFLVVTSSLFLSVVSLLLLSLSPSVGFAVFARTHPSRIPSVSARAFHLPYCTPPAQTPKAWFIDSRILFIDSPNSRRASFGFLCRCSDAKVVAYTSREKKEADAKTRLCVYMGSIAERGGAGCALVALGSHSPCLWLASRDSVGPGQPGRSH